MEQNLTAVATALSAPEELVMRSARARAAAGGGSVEEVLAAWAGGGPAPEPASAADAPVPEAPAPESAAAGAEPGPTAAEAEPADETPDEAEAEAETEQEDEPIPEVAGGLPRWLVALFVIIPVFAVLYALFLPNGPSCGDAGSLAIDPVTGQAVNCDGSEYGTEVIDYFAIGEEIYLQCTSCHGEGGAGGGNFPGFTGGALLATFPEGSCADQARWIELGTNGWPETTYGANTKPVGGSGAQMPPFGGTLSDEELRAVSLYERIQFGGQALDAALADCGLERADESVASE